MAVSAATGENIYEFRKAIAELAPEEKKGHLFLDQPKFYKPMEYQNYMNSLQIYKCN